MGFFDFLKGKKDAPKGAGKPAEAGPKEADLIGEVESFYKKVGVAVIKVKKGPIKVGDTIWIKGHTTDMKFAIDQMQIDHQDVPSADKGSSVGVKVKKRCRGGDGVYRA